MATTTEAAPQTAISPTKHRRFVSLRLPLREASSFNLEKAVCSHGLFMMAPNRWNPVSRTFQRPLRLVSSPSTSLPVSISQSPHSDVLDICVSGTDSLSTQDQEAILGQVRRMLRISEGDDRVVWEFHKLHDMAKKKGFGRIFRSPSLFEDMVKCILLCNCTSDTNCCFLINKLKIYFFPSELGFGMGDIIKTTIKAFW